MARVALLLLSLVSFVSATGRGNRVDSVEYLLSLISSPKPRDVPADFDCAWRDAAAKFALTLQPWLTAADVQHLVDALAQKTLGCNTSVTDALLSSHVPTLRLAPAARGVDALYVDFAHGADTNSGSQAAPLKTIAAAVAASRVARQTGPVPSIILRGGTHVLSATIALTPADSALSFSAFPGEMPTVTGAQQITGLVWTAVNRTGPAWGPVLNDTNAVFGAAGEAGVPDMGVLPSWQACQASCEGNASCMAWTYHTPACTDCAPFIHHCVWRTDSSFPQRHQVGVISQARTPGLNVWSAPLVLAPGVRMTAMQVNGHRATLARYPNANSERDIFPTGYILGGSWVAPALAPVWNETYTVDLGVMADPAAGMYIKYTTGIGGNADRYEPPRSFWASADFGPKARWHEMHLRSPQGLDTGTDLPHAPYADTSQLTVHTWRLSHWFSWMFSNITQTNTLLEFGSGGHQGGEGCDEGQDWWVDGVFEELDAPNEYFHDVASGVLYFYPNTTDADPATGAPPSEIARPDLSIFFSTFGSEETPVRNVTFSGITFVGGRPTFMEPRGVPSGGDWALERQGVLLFEGTEDILVQGCTFTNIDGNAVFLSGRNRRAVIDRNSFALLGQSAIASWGRSDDWDGTGGQQPRHTRISGNLATEVGLIQKQSSFYFQAQSCETEISGNIVYNIPRAGINVDDGFGGANNVHDNLMFNTCRESSDHSAANSWSRMPYVTLVRDGVTPSAIPALNLVHHNFFINNYGADGGCWDTDDGSSWYEFDSNACIYSGHKSDFDGHSKTSKNNLHLYSTVYGNRCLEIGAQQLPMSGYPETYTSNICVLLPNAQCIDLGQSAGNFPATASEFHTRLVLGNNTIYNNLGTACAAGGTTFKTFAELQAAGYETPTLPPSTVSTDMPSAALMIEWVEALLAGASARL